MTKLYKLRPMDWESAMGLWVPSMGMLACGHRFYIAIQSAGCELYQYQHPERGDAYLGRYETVAEAQAAAEKLAEEEALRWVEEVTPKGAS